MRVAGAISAHQLAPHHRLRRPLNEGEVAAGLRCARPRTFPLGSPSTCRAAGSLLLEKHTVPLLLKHHVQAAVQLPEINGEH